MATAYLLLGSNEGDRKQWLEEAMRRIEATCGRILKRSAVYSTAAWGLEEQPDFLNMALALDTVLSTQELLRAIQAIELGLGRQRTLKWGQRTLDIDILFYNDDIIDTPELTVPHPHLRERRFALVPMNDIAAGYVHPVYRKTVSELLADCSDPLEARKY